ncbi:MAG: MFS transporter [Candidatus Bathyarchaeota archaeon]
MRERFKGVYFGWYTVLAGAIIACWGYGSWYYGMSALFKPLIDEYGWTRAQLSAAFSMRSIEGGLEGPFGGMLIDRYGPRIITIVSTVIASLGLFLVLFVRDIWQFVLIWGFVVSLGFNLGLYDSVNAAVAKWFVRKRGRAISLVTIGGGLGAPVVVPIMTWIIVNYGWRTALIFVAISTLAICLPLAWFWMRDHPPEYYGLLPDGNTVVKNINQEEIELGSAYEEYEFTPRQALGTQSFWMMLIAFALNGGILAMVTMHQMPYLEDIGINPLAAAGVLGTMATMSLPGRVVFAWVGDRWGERNSLMLGYAMKTLGLLIWTTARTLPQIALFVVLFGLGYGGTIPVQTSLRASFFGRKAYATITGYTTFFTALTNIIYPIFAGWTYDISGSYTNAFMIIAGLQALAILFMYFAKKPRPESSRNRKSKELA